MARGRKRDTERLEELRAIVARLDSCRSGGRTIYHEQLDALEGAPEQKPPAVEYTTILDEENNDGASA